MFKLDYSKAQVLQLSNDAFFYLTEEEEMLDDTNMEEAEEVFSMFPNGFYVEENWKAVEQTDLIEATFVPYVEDNDGYDEYQDLTQNIQFQIKWLGPDSIRGWWYDRQKNTRELRGDFKVYTNAYGHKCFHTGDQGKGFVVGKESLYFLKHFHKRKT